MLTVEGKHICDRIVKHISDYNDIYFFRTNQMGSLSSTSWYYKWKRAADSYSECDWLINNEIKHDKSHWFKRLIKIHKMRCTDTLGQGPFISPYTKNLDPIGWVVR